MLLWTINQAIPGDRCCLSPQIPLLHRIMTHAERPLSLVSSPWTSPAWLRVNNKVYGKSRIKGEPGDRYHKAWARYFIR